ncbi:hypothetical protein VFPFJ_06198 [Purpureocillium lilacinum]|uniref:Uncharacterized protein n=1 Tax=Purpureocillium lilacinum TaxID=33203 RepID=A0A179HIC5_PURLI|nr:hypothetical protein VFPFJ_06198 [Purpureocillium lilacinum]OAQ89784.1 hypothetical protein VFPFJ_06198 [Purpureocillium lilacinum]
MGFKDIFKSKDKQKSSSDAGSSKENPFAQPTLAPGAFGQFPQTFGFYFLGRAPDKKTDAFLFAEGGGQQGPLRPLNAITVHKGMVKVQDVLHAGPTRDTQPIGLAGTEKLFRSASVIALPSHAGAAGGNQIVHLVDNGGIKFERWAFSVPVAGAAEAEQFEWRSDNLVRPEKDRPFERRLVRVSTSAEGREDVVMRWADDPAPEQESRLGTVHFEGAGATGQLGQYWALAAVVALLRIVQVKSEAQVAADGMLQAAGKLAGLGLGFA